MFCLTQYEKNFYKCRTFLKIYVSRVKFTAPGRYANKKGLTKGFGVLYRYVLVHYRANDPTMVL